MLEAKLKTALDESRLLILGAQVLFGFLFQSFFQERFGALPEAGRLALTAGLVFLLASVGLLIAPSLHHQVRFGGDSRIAARRTRVVKDVESDAGRKPDKAGSARAGRFWHRAACDKIIAAFEAIGYPAFTIGHAQKWLNMTLKYIFVLGDRMPGYQHLFGFCHVPLDQFVMKSAAPLGVPPLPGTGAWSTLRDYDAYMTIQRWFRAQDQTPPLVDRIPTLAGVCRSILTT